MLPGVAGALTAAGADWVTTAAVLAWELAVETAGVAAAVTVRDALVVGTLAAAASFGRDVADRPARWCWPPSRKLSKWSALVSANRPLRIRVRGVDVETFESVLLAGGVDVRRPR